MVARNIGHYRITEKIGAGGMGEVYPLSVPRDLHPPSVMKGVLMDIVLPMLPKPAPGELFLEERSEFGPSSHG
jgi:hypothetical protein